MHEINYLTEEQGLITEEFEVRAQDSLLVGSVHATKSVDLRTSNSPISMDVSLINNDSRVPSQVILKSSNR